MKGIFRGYEEAGCGCCTEAISSEPFNLTPEQIQELNGMGFDFKLGYTYDIENLPQSIQEENDSRYFTSFEIWEE